MEFRGPDVHGLSGRTRPTEEKKVTFGRTQVKMDVDEECSSSPMEVGNVSAMTVKMKEELEMHRVRGHIPFMSECPHCRMTREG